MSVLSASGRGEKDRSSPKRSSIRRSTARDLAVIRGWLEDEHARELPGNFLCNIEVIERAHEEGDLLVYIDGTADEAIAFQLGGLIRPGILAVRHEYRRHGIGRKLTERCIALARRRNQPLLYITCKPSTSIPFWKAIGFTMIADTRSSNAAYRVLETPLPVPTDGVPVDVEISYYPNSRLWDETTQPYVTERPNAYQTSNGVIHLDRRVAFHQEAVQHNGDLVIEVVVNAMQLHVGKAKYEESEALGFVRCTNGYYVDQIVPATVSWPQMK